MTRPDFSARSDFARPDCDRPEGLMADLTGCDRAARVGAPSVQATAQPTAQMNRLPNRRALAVLDQMFGYYDMEERAEIVDCSYDAAA